MPTSLKRRAPFVGLAAALALVAFLHSLKTVHSHSDPDRYFHLAVARLTAEGGLVKELPQIEDMGWKYADKNFGFTLITAVFYRLGGERAVEWVPLLLGLCLIGLLFRHGQRHLGDPAAALTPVLLLVCVVPFFERTVLLRPHTLALLCFTWLTTSLTERKPVSAALAAAVFALSYHAIYLPAALIALACLLSSRLGNGARATATWATGGLAIGVFAHPDFPLNARDAWTTLRIALGAAGVPGGQRPIEEAGFGGFLPFLQAYGGLFLVGAAAAARLWPPRGKALFGEKTLAGKARRELTFLFAAASGLLLLTLVSRRAVEYSAPVFAVVLMHWTASLQRRGPALGALAAGLALFHLPVVASFYRTGLSPGVRDLPNQTLEALRDLPVEADGRKVFNCEWDITPMVLYARPKVHFVDILGPSALLETSPVKYWLRRRLNEGAVPYPFGVVRHLFQGDYALCDNPRLVGQWDRDPHFFRLHPKGEYRIGQMALFSVEPGIRPEFLLDYEWANGKRWDPMAFQNQPPRPQRSPSVDLERWARENAFSSLASCVSLRPAPEELAAHEGADLVGVSGGPEVRVFINSAKYPAPYPAPGEPPRLVSALIRMPHPLRKSDTLTAEVCGLHSASYPFLSLSLWKTSAVRELCARKGIPVPEGRATASMGISTCLGLIVDQ